MENEGFFRERGKTSGEPSLLNRYVALILTAAFLCLVINVTDGDGLLCADGTKVRLAAIDAPEKGRCPRNRVCAPGDGKESRKALSRMAMGQTLRCRANGTSYDRVTAWCSVNGVDLSCQMVRQGYAIHWLKYDRQRRLCRK